MKGQKAGQKGVSKRPPNKEPVPTNGNGSESTSAPLPGSHPDPEVTAARSTQSSNPTEASGALSWLAAIVQSSDDAIISMDLMGSITSWNAAAEKIYGYSPSEVIGTHVSLLIPEDRVSEEEEILERARRGERTDHYETIRRRKDGINLYVSVSVSPIRDADGRIIGASKIARDITERKRIEERLDKNRLMLSLAMQGSRMGAWERDFATGIVWWSEELEQIFGLETGAFSESENEFYDLIHEDDRANVWAEVENSVKEHRGYIVEFRFRHADGSWRWMEGRGEAVYSQKGQPVRLYGVGIDITERKLGEQKSGFLSALDHELQATSDAEDAMNTASRMIGQFIAADRCVYCEVEDEKVFIVVGNYTNGLPSTVGRWQVASFGNACVEAMNANRPFVVFDVEADSRIRSDDLPPYHASMTRSLICVPLFKNGTFTAAIAVHHASPRVWTESEIEVVQLAVNRCWESLERIRAIRNLRESDERFRLSLSSGALTVFEQDAALGYKWVYPETPYRPDLIGKTDVELSPGPYGERLTDLKRRVLETGTALREEVEATVLGKQKWFDLLIEPRFDAIGNVIGVGGTALEITEKKAAEIELAAAAERLNVAFSAADLGDWSWNTTTDAVDFSERAAEIFGVPYGRYMTWTEMQALIHPDDRERVRREVEISVEYSGRYDVEYRVIRPDGEQAWVAVLGQTSYDADDAPLGMFGVVRDITSKRLLQEAVTESEERFRGLMEQAPFSIQLFDPDGRTVTVNKAWQELWGIKLDRIPEYNVLTDPQLEAKGITPILRRAFAGESVDLPAIEYDPDETAPDGSSHANPKKWVSAVAYPLRDGQGHIRQVVLVHQDITERMRAQMLLDSQKESMEMVLRGSPLSEVLAYLVRTVEEQSGGKVAASILLLDQNGCLRNGASPSLPEDYLNAIDGIKAESHIGTCSAAAAERRIVITRDFETDPKWTQLKHLPLGIGFKGAWSKPIMSQDGSVLGTFGTYFKESREPNESEIRTVEILSRTAALAIERRAAEDALRESSEFNQDVIDSLASHVAVIDSDGMITAVNRAWQKFAVENGSDWSMSGVGVGASYLKVCKRAEGPDSDKANDIHEGILDVLHGHRNFFALEYPCHSPASKRWFLLTVSPLSRGGAVISHLNITDRRLAEEGMRQTARQLELVTNTAPVYICYCDTGGRYKFVNKAYAARFGLKPEDCVGKLIEDVVGPEAHTIFSRYIDAVLSGRMVELEIEVPYGSIGSRFMHCSYAPEFDSDGRVVGYVGALIDITQRRKIEEEVRRANERFRIAEEASKGFVYDLDLEANTVTRSDGFAKVLGYEIGEISDTGESWLQLIKNDDLATLKKRLDSGIRDGAERIVSEYRVRHKNGSYIWILDECAVVRDRDERPIRLVGSAVDITTRKQAESRLTLLSEISEISRTVANPKDLMYQVSAAVGQHFQVRRCLFNEIDLENDTETVHRDYCRGVASVTGTHPVSGYSRITTADMIAGITVINNDSRIDPRTAADYEKTYKPARERSYITVPLLRGGRWVASLWISDDKPREWTNQEVSLLETIAERTWTAVEKLRIDADLRESQSHLQITTEAAKVGTWRWDVKNHDLIWSDIHKDLWGYVPDQRVTYEDWLAAVDVLDRSVVEDAIDRSLTHNENYDVEYRVRRADNDEQRWIRSTGRAEFDADGKALSIQGISIDITERKLAETIVQRQARLIDQSYEPILVWSETEGIIEWNAGSEQLYGFTREEAIGRQSRSLLSTRHPGGFDEFLSAIEKNGEWTGELQQTTKDGRNLIVESRQQMIELDGTRLVLETNRDITLRKEAETIMQRYQLLSEHARDMIWLLRPDGQIVEANKAAIDTYGYTRDELLQMNVKQLRDGSTFSTLDGQLRDAILGNVHFETLHVKKDGTVFPVEVRANSAEIGGERYLMSIIRDITERKNAEKVLRESEERFAKAFNASPLVVTITSLRTGRLAEVNQTFVDVTGIPREEAIGRTTAELGFWAPKDREGELSTLQSEGSIRNKEYIFKVKGGSEEIVGLLSAEMLEIGGEPSALTVIQDVTERKRSEESLRQSEQRLQQLADAMPQVVWVADPDGKVTYYNHRVSEFHGVRQDERGHWNLEPSVHPDDLEATSLAWKNAVDRKGNYSIEHRIRMTDGQFRWHLSRALPIINKDGELQRWFGTATDIHDLKVAEEKMLAAERRAAEEYYDMLSRIVPLAQSLGTARDLDTVYRGVLNFVQSSMPCSAFFVSFYESEANLRLAAYAWGTGVGEIDASKLPPLQLTEDGGPNSQAVFQRRPIIVNRYMDHMKGRNHVVVQQDGIDPNSSMAVPMIVMDQVIGTLEVQAYENGVFTREHVIAIEMVANLAAVAIENVRLIETEAKARKEAEAANRMKDEFLSVLSHELRTPLNAMLGWVRMLRTGVLDKERTSKALEVIERNTRQQGSLIEDLLDVSRIISGRMRIEKDLVDIVPIINVAAETVRPLALNKGLTLEVVADLEPLYLNGDAVRLQQVIVNLLQNAVKFTPAGGEISLTLEKVGNEAVITVSDTGVGIETAFLPNIFDRFSQADASTRRSFTGLGLGLTIVRTIVELHDGEIHAESGGKDKGATFKVKLPLREEFYQPARFDTPVVATNVGAAKLGGMSILLVDDDPESLQPVQIFLESHEAIVHCASSVNEALAKLAEHDFDLLVSDIGMPTVDGYQFIELVRGSKTIRNSSIPAIALTAYASTDDREKAISAGFQNHLTKPVDFELLLDAIESSRQGTR